MSAPTTTESLRNFVNGEYAHAQSGETAAVLDPATEEVIAHAPVSGAADVDTAFRAAAAAFDTWRDTTPGERQLALLRIADAIQDRSDELVTIESSDTGKPRAAAAFELAGGVDQLRFFAGAARNLEGRAAAEYAPNLMSMIRREPIGVVGQVAPWNYPLMMAIWKIAPALAAGNTLVLKPSGTTPLSTLKLAEIAAEFLPAGVFNVITGDRDTGRALVEHPVPQLISITGSTRAGVEVARSAATDVKRLHLELGGKSPVIVFDDADIAAAVAHLTSVGYYNAGQDCTAATRFLVADTIHDEFVAALSAAASALVTDGPGNPEAYYGPVNNENQLSHVAGVVDRLPDHAIVETGGRRTGERGYFYAPTVVSGLRQDDEAVQTEIFGPVVTVQKFTDESEALALANGVRYGLGSSVWTKDHARALRMSRRLDFGVVWLNTHTVMAAEMPHGGFKHSGYGKDLSSYAFEEYTRIKHVMSNLEG